MDYSKVLLLCFFALFLAGSALTEEITRDFYFDEPLVAVSDEGATVYIPGCLRMTRAGRPALPLFSACFILPAGETVQSISFETSPESAHGGRYSIAPAPIQAPTGVELNVTEAGRRDSSIYSMSSPYPAASVELAGEHTLSGIRFAFVNIYPCRTVPSSGELLFTGRIKVTIHTAPAAVSRPHPLRAVEKAADWARRSSVNAARLADYIPRHDEAELFASSSLEQEVYPVVIITSAGLESAFGQLAALKNELGLRTKVITTDYIQSNYAGADIQAQIRAFITHAYFNFHSEYIILGGDDEIIPHRGFYVRAGTEIEPDIPSDIYYSCLDGNWNTDGDSYFGEPGEEDLLPELSVGRVPAGNEAEVQNFIAKLDRYSRSPLPDDCEEAAFLGELLWNEDGVVTWGGDYKDETISGTDNYGFETGGIPQNLTSHILYDREVAGSWNDNDLIPLLNSGVNLVNHLGHTGLLNAMHLSAANIPLLENNGTSANPAVFYSQGCYAASFDNRDYAGQVYSEDAIGEQLLNGESGAVAFIGNSRYGWNAPGSTCGVSQFFDRQFVDAVFGEGITGIGDAIDDSRIDNIPYISYPLVRYVMYGMTLLGDPSMDIWTGRPEQISAMHDSLIPPGISSFEIELLSGQNPVRNARVSVYTADYSLYSVKRTGLDGRATFLERFPDAGTVQIRATSSSHFPYADSIIIDSMPDTLIELGTVLINDDSTGGSIGDGDGIIESGETVQLGSIISNKGSFSSDSCFMNLVCSDPYISVSDSSSDYFEMPERTTLILEDEFRISLREDTPDSYNTELMFRINTPQGILDMRREVLVNAPDLGLAGWRTCDTLCGNGNGCIEPWEFITLSSTWVNRGSSETEPLLLELSTTDARYCRIYKSETVMPVIPAGDTVTVRGNFSIFIKPEAPPFTTVPLVLTLKKDKSLIRRDSITVTTCGNTMEDNCNEGSFWSGIQIVGPDQWHISSEQSCSAPSSWKCGSVSGDPYPNMLDTALESPPLCLGENSSLTFWHRISAEAGSSYPYWAEDAGVVEISTDAGESWQILSPTSGYPCRASSVNTIFLDPYQRCYSGEQGWEFQEFDLSSYTGAVLLRFHFASNEQYGFEGWFIDDITISTDIYTGTDNPGILTDRMFHAKPNPFNPSTTVSFQTAGRSHAIVQVFDVRGRLIKTLLDRIVDPGLHECIWHGENSHGEAVASGVYLCRMRTGSFSSAQRLVLLR